MTPDPTRDVELTVWSPYWVEAEDLVALLAPVLPGAHLDIGRPHDEPPPRAGGCPGRSTRSTRWPSELEEALTPELLQRLEDVAEATDAWAEQEMASWPTGTPSSATAASWSACRSRPASPAGSCASSPTCPRCPTDRLVTYDIRWWPEDVGQLHLESPPTAHRIARRIVGRDDPRGRPG